MSASLRHAVSAEQLLGLNDRHLVTSAHFGCALHPVVFGPLERLAERAGEAGFELRVASGHRSFERQRGIWNAKARGERPVLDERDRPVDMSALSEAECLRAILRFSALPGTSRHHWGTDLDVFDASRLPQNYRLQLTASETRGEGVCAEFHRWLDAELAAGRGEGFYRPYGRDRGGVAPEPWHLSYAPLADALAGRLTPALWREHLAGADIALREAVLAELDAVFARFVDAPRGTVDGEMTL